MTRDEIDKVVDRLAALWPDAHTDVQLSDMIQRLSKHTLDDCLYAIDRWRDTEPYKPQPANLLRIIAARSEGRNRTLERFPDIIRRQTPELSAYNDAYVLWVYFRSQWRDGRKRILSGYSGMTAEQKVKHKADVDQRIAANTERWAGDLCRQLVAHGYDEAAAEATAAWIGAPDVRELVEALAANEPARASVAEAA